MEQIHDFTLPSLANRNYFKTWKSLFQIHHWQTIKKERLECHVCMEDLLPSLSVLLRCLRCVNFFLQKNKGIK